MEPLLGPIDFALQQNSTWPKKIRFKSRRSVVRSFTHKKNYQSEPSLKDGRIDKGGYPGMVLQCSTMVLRCSTLASG